MRLRHAAILGCSDNISVVLNQRCTEFEFNLALNLADLI
ncbi:MAG: hypothetical protein RLZZ511_1089 [Cyanobacteriota bacterium]|jgi:hypothetical protein